MKKMMAMLLAMLLCLSLVACGGDLSAEEFEALKTDYNDMVGYYEDSIAYLNQYPDILAELDVADDVNSMADSVNEIADTLNGVETMSKDDAEAVQGVIDTVYDSLDELNNAVESAAG